MSSSSSVDNGSPDADINEVFVVPTQEVIVEITYSVWKLVEKQILSGTCCNSLHDTSADIRMNSVI